MTFHGDTSFVRYLGQDRNDIASLSEVKLSARVDTSDEDDFIQDCMVQAKTFLEGDLARLLDDAEYKVKYKFDNPPCAGDKLWISVAPVDEVTLDGNSVNVVRCPNNFDSYVEYESDWDTAEMVLTVSTSCADWIDKSIKSPFYTVCATYYRYREFSLARDTAANNVVVAALRPYKREV